MEKMTGLERKRKKESLCGDMGLRGSQRLFTELNNETRCQSQHSVFVIAQLMVQYPECLHEQDEHAIPPKMQMYHITSACAID